MALWLGRRYARVDQNQGVTAEKGMRSLLRE